MSRLAKKAVLPMRECVSTRAMTMMARKMRSGALALSSSTPIRRSRWRQETALALRPIEAISTPMPTARHNTR